MASKSEISLAAQLVPVKLNEDNYGLWKSLIIPILKNYNMINTVLGTEQPSTSQTVTDKNCFDFLQSTLSPDMLPYSVGCSSVHALWRKLEEQGWIAQCRLGQLRSRLEKMNKSTSSTMKSYYKAKRQMADRLNAAGRPVAEADFIKYVLEGLPASYDRFVKEKCFAGIANGMCREELFDLLVAEESRRDEERLFYARLLLGLTASCVTFLFLVKPNCCL